MSIALTIVELQMSMSLAIRLFGVCLNPVDIRLVASRDLASAPHPARLLDGLEGVEIRIGQIDPATNRRIAGYTAEECQPITDDHLDTAIRTCHPAAL